MLDRPVIEKLISDCDCAIAFIRKDQEAVIALNGNTDDILDALAKTIVRFIVLHKNCSSSLENALRETQLLISFRLNELMKQETEAALKKQFQ